MIMMDKVIHRAPCLPTENSNMLQPCRIIMTNSQVISNEQFCLTWCTRCRTDRIGSQTGSVESAEHVAELDPDTTLHGYHEEGRIFDALTTAHPYPRNHSHQGRACITNIF